MRLKRHHPAADGVADNLDFSAPMNAIQISWVLGRRRQRQAWRPSTASCFKPQLNPGVAEHHCIVQFSDGTRAGDLQALTPALFSCPGASAGALFDDSHHRRSPCLNFNGCSATPCSVVDRFWRRRGLSPLVLRPGSTIRRAIPCCFWLPWSLSLRCHDRLQPGGLQFLQSL